MKQHHLSTKFLRFYILIGILGFFLITLGGSYMVEKHLEHSLSAALYTEAHNIASNEAVKSNISSSTVDTLQEHLCAISGNCASAKRSRLNLNDLRLVMHCRNDFFHQICSAHTQAGRINTRMTSHIFSL